MKQYEQKIFLRKDLKKKRNSLSKEYQEIASKKISLLAASLAEFQLANHIAIYCSYNNEVNTNYIIADIINNNKKHYLPIISKEKLIFVAIIKQTTFITNQYGITEPKLISNEHQIKLSKLDLIFLPLLGYDLQGNRLGMGKGHYDKTLAKLTNNTKPLIIGLAYQIQEVELIPTDVWDKKLHIIINENKLIDLR